MLALQHDEAHLWLAECEGADAREFAGMLSGDERRRAAGFASSKLADEFVTQRATLRSVLAAYLDQSPADIAIIAEAQGKPVLADAQRANDLTFNLSHSGQWMLIGIARGRRIGVDIQIERPTTRCLDLARRFFADDEAEMLARVDPDRQTRVFFALWTLKEAYLKATGEGIAGGLNRVRVAIDSCGSARIAGADDQWQLRQLDVADGYAAAMAIEGAAARIRCARWRLGLPPPESRLLRDGFR
jgi:4'-phosphopantetheinyl transferase